MFGLRLAFVGDNTVEEIYRHSLFGSGWILFSQNGTRRHVPEPWERNSANKGRGLLKQTIPGSLKINSVAFAADFCFVLIDKSAIKFSGK